MGLITVQASTDFVDFGSGAAIDDIQEGTLLFRFKPATVANGAHYGFTKTTDGTQGWLLSKQSSDGTSMIFAANRATTDLARATITGVLVAGIPLKIAVTWSISGSTINWYAGGIGTGAMVDVGAVLQGGSGSYVSDAATSLKMGDPAGTSIAWGAEWYEAALFGSVLSLADCNVWGYVPHGTGALAFWRFGKTGATAVDETGNGHDGTVTGATQTVIGPVVGPRNTFGSSKLFSVPLIR